MSLLSLQIVVFYLLGLWWIGRKLDGMFSRLNEYGPNLSAILRRQDRLQEQYDRLESKVLNLAIKIDETNRLLKIRAETEKARKSISNENTLDVQPKKKRGRPRKND